MTGRRRPTVILVLVGIAAAAVAVAALVSGNQPRRDPGAAATSHLPRVAGVSRTCLLDPGRATVNAVDVAAWTRLQSIAAQRPLLVQRTPAVSAHPSKAERVTLLDSAVARRCDAVVVIGTEWDRALADAAPRHREVRFVAITTATSDRTSPRANVSVIGYKRGVGFVPSLDGVLPR